MFGRGFAAAIALTAALGIWQHAQWRSTTRNIRIFTGQWVAVRIPGVRGQPAYDPTKSWGLGQEAPLTPEYQKVLEASLADQAKGGQGGWPTGWCLPPGMPAMMTLYRPMEIVVLPEITYILIDHAINSHRRIYTDGRDWPEKVEPSFDGYSIGKWIDPDGSGRYSVLEVETRYFKGPRAFDPAGLPTHTDNQTVVKERFFFDKANPALLHDEMTVMDHALTRPWTVMKTYRRDRRRASGLAGGQLRPRQRIDSHRRGDLLPERGRPPHADAQGPAAAGSAVLQAVAEVAPRRGRQSGQRMPSVAELKPSYGVSRMACGQK